METGTMNETIQTIMTRTSVREFSGEKASRENLETILKAAMAAPSAVNVQPWVFIAVTDDTILARLEEGLPYAKMLRAAGSAIVVCGVPNKDDTFAKLHWEHDCSAAAENILLAARALGLGAVWTAVHPDKNRVQTVRDVCRIPPEVIPFAVIPVGIPAKQGAAPKDKFRDENIHWERWQDTAKSFGRR